MEKIQKSNEKKIESIQSDRDDAQKINRLTQDVYQLKQRMKAIAEKRIVFIYNRYILIEGGGTVPNL